MKIHGACHCRAITFEADVDPADVTICHCTDCQSLTGSAYRVSVPADARDFTLRTGRPRLYVKTGDSGAPRIQAFCADCGTPLYTHADEDPPRRYGLRVGTLAERAALPPHKQKWCRSALPWSMSIERLPRRDGE